MTAGQTEAVCRRAFGQDARALAAAELGGGMYNTTFRVTVAGKERPVILRVALEPARHSMRGEYAFVPWLTVMAPLMPKVIAADGSHEVIGRDWMVRSLQDGVPAPELLGAVRPGQRSSDRWA